jgi:hypothetical protein
MVRGKAAVGRGCSFYVLAEHAGSSFRISYLHRLLISYGLCTVISQHLWGAHLLSMDMDN